MSNITSQQSSIRNDVLTKGWKYLFENFDKFTESNKIKICIALLGKDMPISDGGASNNNQRVVVYIQEKDGSQSQTGRISTSVSVIPE